jgi:predicted transcriptional regulator
MDVIWRRGRATVAEVRREMPDPPSYSAVRTLLGLLEQKGHLRHEQDGPRYVYLPTADREKEQRTALRHLVRTFFDGSAERAMAALLDLSDSKLSADEVRRLTRLLEQARSQGR